MNNSTENNEKDMEYLLGHDFVRVNRYEFRNRSGYLISLMHTIKVDDRKDRTYPEFYDAWYQEVVLMTDNTFSYLPMYLDIHCISHNLSTVSEIFTICPNSEMDLYKDKIIDAPYDNVSDFIDFVKSNRSELEKDIRKKGVTFKTKKGMYKDAVKLYAKMVDEYADSIN